MVILLQYYLFFTPINTNIYYYFINIKYFINQKQY